MKHGRIEGSVVLEIFEGEINENFHPDIVKQFVAVPDNIEAGWVLEQGQWQAPEEEVTPSGNDNQPQNESVVSPIDFMLLFTSVERVALKNIRKTNDIINDFFEIIDDPRLEEVHLDRQSNQQGVGYCFTLLVDEDVITNEELPVRLNQVLSNITV